MTNILFTSIDYTIQVRKGEKIRNQYNQVQHLTQDTTWESDNSIVKQNKREPRDDPFPAGDHKAAMNGRKSMTNTRVSKTILLDSLSQFHSANISLSSDVYQDT